MGASAALAVAAAVVTGCSTSEPSAPVQQRDRDSSPDAPDTGGHGRSTAADDDTDEAAAGRGDASAAIASALDARATDDPQTFVALLDDAREACTDLTAKNRLGELGVLAGRWADAVADGRPKVQAVIERQLSAADWEALAEACAHG